MKDIALTYAARGWQIFPCAAHEKTPLTQHGFKDATTDPAQIAHWWDAHPDANIGLPCGANGLVVIDLDGAEGVSNWNALRDAHNIDAETAVSRTGGGGYHLVFLAPEGVELKNSTGKLAKSVDVRANGGYIVLPPSIHPSGKPYEWKRSLDEIKPLSEALLKLLTEPTKPTLSNGNGRPDPITPAFSRYSPYAQAALDGEIADLRAATKGTRNHHLNKAAFALGQLIGAGELDRADVEQQLYAAARVIGYVADHGERATWTVINAGIEAGMKEPRVIPDHSNGRKQHNTPPTTAECAPPITSADLDDDDTEPQRPPPTLEERIGTLEEQIEQIPADVSKVRLPLLLRPVLEELAQLDKSIATTFLTHIVKERFKLTRAEMIAYESDLVRFRKNWQRSEQARKAQVAEQAHAAAAKPKEITAEERAEALAFLQDPRLVERIVEDITDLGYVGEDNNKVIQYLIATSRKRATPLHSAIKSPSAWGKSELVKKVAALMPQEEIVEFTRLTAHALDYMGSDSLKHKWVIVTERNGSEASDYSLRVIQSEQKISIAYPVKDPVTGEIKTVDHLVNGPIAYTETTTRPTIHGENATRVYELYLDGSQRQTQRIHAAQRKSATLDGIFGRLKRGDIIRRHQNAQRLLEPVEVVIPYAELIEFPSDNPRTRRDFPRFIETLGVIAFLRQKRKERKTRTDSSSRQQVECIEADLEDYAIAYKYVAPVIAAGLDELPRHSRVLLERIGDGIQKWQAEDDGKPDSQKRTTFTRSDIADWAGATYEHAERYVKALERKEYLDIESGGNGKKYVYRLGKKAAAGAPVQIQELTSPDDLAQAIAMKRQGTG